MGEIRDFLKPLDPNLPNRTIRGLEKAYGSMERLREAKKEDMCKVWGVGTKRYHHILDLANNGKPPEVKHEEIQILGKTVRYTDSEGARYEARCIELSRDRLTADLAIFPIRGHHIVRRRIPHSPKGVPNSWRIP